MAAQCNTEAIMKNSIIIMVVCFAAHVAISAESGDAARGKALSGACVGCHQEDGNGRDNASGEAWPRLAGLDAEYLAAQLAAYKSGERKSASMKTFSRMMDEQKMADIAAYYATLPPAPVTAAAAPPEEALLARGKVLAEQGDSERNIQPCTQCHGADNRGDGKIPAITAQPALYLRAQIIAWQRGDRPNDSADDKGMFPNASHLNKEDSAAVAAWLSTQEP